MALKIEYINTEELVPYLKNTRQHSAEQVEQIVGSIKEFGFTNPVLVDQDNVLIAGHGRTLAAQQAGLEQVPAIRLNGLSEAQRKALRIADNQLPQNATWDMDLLAEELQELELEDFDLDLLGFEPEFLDDLLDGVDEEEPGEEEPEEALPEPQPDPVSVEGDLWVLGKHRLLCGDSTNIQSIEELIAASSVDMVFTDPPYNMDFTGGLNVDGTKSFNANHGGIKNDKMSKSEADQFFDDINGVIASYCRGPFYITFYRLGIYDYWKSLDRCGLQVRSLVIWDKGNHTLSNSDYMSMYEPIFYGWVGEHHNFYGGKNGRDIWPIARTKKNDLHPTMKPIELVEKAVKEGSKRGDLVLDLFGGSGSTLIACENAGRKARLMELDPKYVDVIVKRWQNLTGKSARLESTGQTFAEVEQERQPEEAA